MLPGSLNHIDEALLSSACAEHWSESLTLDFKQSLPGTDDRSKQEFLKDVCAFANASGGDLVYGIRDSSGQADQIVPIPIGLHPLDATKRRLGQLLEAGLEPRADGVVLHPVTLATGDYVLVVRVPASFQRPHRYRSQNHTRWVVRADTHTVDLTYDQIRDAFDRSASITERARRFREERLAGVLAGTTGRPLRPGPRCVVHLIPLASIAGKATVDVRALHYDGFTQFASNDWGGVTRSFNLDGLVVYAGSHTADLVYTQVFRSGALEAARWVGALIQHDEESKSSIPSGVASGVVRDSLAKFFAATARWNIGGPAIAAVALLDIGKFRFRYQQRNFFPSSSASDRPHLILPEVWIEDLSSVGNADEIARPLLDTMWQAFDIERCMFYDAEGRWDTH